MTYFSYIYIPIAIGRQQQLPRTSRETRQFAAKMHQRHSAPALSFDADQCKFKEVQYIRTCSSIPILLMCNVVCVFFSPRYKKSNITTPDDRETVHELEKSVMKRKAQLYEIEQSLPQKNSLYLQVCIFNRKN